MNLTLSQAFERTKDLSGAIKAARAHEADCADDHAAKQKIADIAGEAHEKASAHCVELEQEREELADHMAALVRKTGETPSAAEEGAGASLSSAQIGGHLSAYGGLENQYANQANSNYGSIFTEPADFQAQALQNGEAKMNQAFDEATR